MKEERFLADEEAEPPHRRRHMVILLDLWGHGWGPKGLWGSGRAKPGTGPSRAQAGPGPGQAWAGQAWEGQAWAGQP